MLECAASRWYREFLAIVIAGAVVGISVWYIHATLVAMHRDAYGGANSSHILTSLNH